MTLSTHMSLGRMIRRSARTIIDLLPAKLRLAIDFYKNNGYWPKLDPPRTFNEKIIFRKLYDRNPLFVILADKLAVRDYVAERIGQDVLTRLFAVYETPEQLEWDSLPDRFVIKANHDQGSVRFVADKNFVSREGLVQFYSVRLNSRCGENREAWWYWPIKPRLLVEEYLNQSDGSPPTDYKLFVFDGRVRMIAVDLSRVEGTRRVHLGRGLYKPNWEPIQGLFKFPTRVDVEPPEYLRALIDVAEHLGKDLDFVRVDLYSIPPARPVVFGEMTLAPSSGYGRFSPRELDYWLGSYWHVKPVRN